MPALTGILADRLDLQAHDGPFTGDVVRGDLRVIPLDHIGGRNLGTALLDRYQRAGIRGLHDRSEDCGLMLFDAAARRLVLSRDQVGLNPLYYLVREGRFYFAARIRDLLRASGLRATPDRAALATALVAGGAPSEGATYFEGIHALPPGCTLIYEDGQARVLPAAGISSSGSNNQFRAVFIDAVRQRLDNDGPTAVQVSGGLDSASIISVADADAVFGITYGLQDGSAADESGYIELLRAAGRDIDRVDFYPIANFASIESNIFDTELPLVDEVSATLQRAAAHARQRGARVLLLGTWGDQVLSPFPPAHLRRIAPWRLLALAAKARAFQQSMRDIDAQFILRALIRQSVSERVPEFLRRARRRARLRTTVFDQLLDELPLVSGPAAPSSYADMVRGGALSPEQTQSIEGLRKWGWANDLDVRLPFLDLTLLRLLLSMSDEQAYRGDSLKPILREAMRGYVPDRLLDRGDKGDYTAAMARGMLPVAAMLPRLDGLRRLISFGIMSDTAAQKTLARLENRREIADADVALAGVLLGLDVWLRIFCEDDHGKEGREATALPAAQADALGHAT